MSYILDALRRADSERERSAIPGLHTQPVPQGSADAHAGRNPRPWVWLAMGVAVVLLGQWLVQWLWHGDTAAAARTASVTPPSSAAPVVPPDADTLDTATPITGHTTLPGDASVPTLREPPPLPATSRKPAPTGKTKTEPTPAVPAAAESRILALDELPDDIRRSLPPLQIGGSVYSENPSSRLLMVNGLLLHEKDRPAVDLVLERIELKAAVLNYKGYRYRITY